jgi:hypothetical protein
MREITVEELEEYFDDIFEGVVKGETFLIRTPDNKDCVLIPYEDYEEYYKEFFEHDDAC